MKKNITKEEEKALLEIAKRLMAAVDSRGDGNMHIPKAPDGRAYYPRRQPGHGMDGGECGRGYRPGRQYQADKGKIAGEDRRYRRCDHGTGPLHPKRRTAAGKCLR